MNINISDTGAIFVDGKRYIPADKEQGEVVTIKVVCPTYTEGQPSLLHIGFDMSGIRLFPGDKIRIIKE